MAGFSAVIVTVLQQVFWFWYRHFFKWYDFFCSGKFSDTYFPVFYRSNGYQFFYCKTFEKQI